MSLLDLVQQQLGPQEIQQISQQVGADPATTENAVHAAVPMLLSGMANGAREPEGASALGGLLGGGGGGALGGLLGGAGGGGLGGLLGGMLGGGGGTAGGGGMDMGGMLGSVLGRSQPAVQDGVQQASGLSGDQTKKLLMILAPIVLMALAKRRQQGAAGAGGAMGGAMGSAMGGSGMGAGMGGIPGMSGATGGMGGLGGMGGGVPANQVDSDGDGIPDYLEREANQAHQQVAQRSPQIGGIVGKILGAAMRPPR